MDCLKEKRSTFEGTCFFIVEVKGSSTKGGEFMKIFEKVVYLLTSIRIPTNCDQNKDII